MLMPSFSASAESEPIKFDGELFFKAQTKFTIAPGVTETHYVINNESGTNQVLCYVLYVDLSESTVSVIASYKNYDATEWGVQTVRQQGYKTEDALGVNVVAGVNADFFRMASKADEAHPEGYPIGTLVMDSKEYVKQSNRAYFAIRKDGVPVIGASNPKTENFKECVGSYGVIVNKGKLTSTVNTKNYGGKTRQPRTAVGITGQNNIIFVVADGRQAPVSCGMTFSQLGKFMIALGCKKVTTLDGGGSSTLVSQYQSGRQLICRNSPSDGKERSVGSSLLICSTAMGDDRSVFDTLRIFLKSFLELFIQKMGTIHP